MLHFKELKKEQNPKLAEKNSKSQSRNKWNKDQQN